MMILKRRYEHLIFQVVISLFERHYFVNLYNRCFLTELSLLSKIAISTTEEIKSYYQDVFDVLYAKDNAKQIFPEKI